MRRIINIVSIASIAIGTYALLAVPAASAQRLPPNPTAVHSDACCLVGKVLLCGGTCTANPDGSCTCT
jgi:hypothetical protein